MASRRTSWIERILRRPKPTARFYRPRLEALEDRTTPAAAGSLDPLFGVGGSAFTPFAGLAQSYGIYRDPISNGIYEIGFTDNGPNGDDIALVRFNPDGTRDFGFGNGGQVITTVGPGADRGYDLTGGAFAGDGKFRLVAVGSTSNGTADSFVVVRYNANGSLDGSFGGTGVVTVNFGTGAASGYRVVFDPNTGKTLVAGTTNAGTGNALALARFNFDGSLDVSFGTGGRLVVPLGLDAGVAGLAVDASGRIVVAGTIRDAAGSDFFALRLVGNGSFDNGFGIGGISQINVGSAPTFDTASALAIDNFGGIVIAGTVQGGSDSDFGIVRLQQNGQLDPTFGAGGRVVAPVVAGQNDVLNDLAIDAGNNAIVVGTTQSTSPGSSRQTVVGAFTEQGVPITNFGVGGFAVTTSSTAPAISTDDARGVAVDSAGGIFVAGTTSYNGQDVLSLKRVVAVSGPPGPNFVLGDDVYSIAPGQPFDLLTSGQPGLLANDVIDFNSPFTVAATPVSMLGSLLVRPDGSFVYAPPTPGFTGTETFTYVLMSGTTQLSSPALVTINVGTAGNSAPVLAPAAFTVGAEPEDPAALSVAVISVASLIPTTIYSDADVGDPRGVAVAFADSTNGTWEFSTNAGANWTAFAISATDPALHLFDTALIRFLPANDYFGAATIEYHGWDRTGTTGSFVDGTFASIAVTGGTSPYSAGFAIGAVKVWEVNDDIVNVSSFVSGPVVEDSGSIVIPIADLLGPGSPGPANEAGQTIKIVAVSNALGGTATFSDFSVTFALDPDFYGPASFDFTLEDNGTTDGVADPRSFSSTVTFGVQPINDAPTGGDVVLAAVAEDSPTFTVAVSSLLAGISPGPNESSQSIDLVGIGGFVGGTAVLIDVNGTTTLNDDIVAFTLDPDFNGLAGFSFTVVDDGVNFDVPTPLQATFQVRIPVSEVNDPPTAEDVFLPPFDAAFGFRFISAASLVSNASPGPANEAGQSLSVVGVSDVVGGSVVLAAGGLFFTPNPGYYGPVSFTIVIADNGTTGGQPDFLTTTARVAFEVAGTAFPPAATTPGGGIIIRAASDGSIVDGGGGSAFAPSTLASLSRRGVDDSMFDQSIRLVPPPTTATALVRAFGNFDERVSIVVQVIRDAPDPRPAVGARGLPGAMSASGQATTSGRILQIVTSHFDGEDNVWIVDGILRDLFAPADARPAGLPAPGAPAPPAPPNEQSSLLEPVREYAANLMLFLGLAANIALRPFADRELFPQPKRRKRGTP